MRAYYATSVYYTTYDITWYAWYGWVWTALEAQLGVMCACAPALKRYFSLGTVRSNTYGYGTRGKSSGGRTPGYGKLSAGTSFATCSHAEAPIPLNRIKVSTTTNIATVKDRDDAISLGSTESTKQLHTSPSTAFPLPIHHDRRVASPFMWEGNLTEITSNRGEHEFDIDIENNARELR